MGRRLTCTIPLPTASTPLRTTILVIRSFATLFVAVGLILYCKLLREVINEFTGPFTAKYPILPIVGAVASVAWNLIAFCTFHFLSLSWHAVGDLTSIIVLATLGSIGIAQDEADYATFPRFISNNGTGEGVTTYNTTEIGFQNGVPVSNYTYTYTEPNGYYVGFDSWDWMTSEKIAGSLLLVSALFQIALIYLNIRAHGRRKAPASTEPQETYASKWARRFPKDPSKSPFTWRTIFTRKPSKYPSKWDVELEEMGHKPNESVTDVQTAASRSEENQATRLEPLVEPKYPTRLVNEDEMKFRGMDLDALKSR